MTDRAVFAGVDLGASSGRVVAATVTDGRIDLEVIHRFPNRRVDSPDGWRWDLAALLDQITTGLRELIGRHGPPASIGIDSWAVDYGILRDGVVVDDPFHYRNERSRRGVELVHARVSAAELYRRNGLQHLPFTTLFQLAVDRADGRLLAGDRIALIPDLVAWALTGRAVSERTVASTTGLVRPGDDTWDRDLAELLGLPADCLTPIVDPGTVIGSTTPDVTRRLGAPAAIPVVAVGAHDTASAIAAIPMDPATAAYVSCGTWALVGVELERPVVTEAGRVANFTNEQGVEGRTRFLRNVMGLWMLDRCVDVWRAAGDTRDLAALVAAAGDRGEPSFLLDVDDPRFSAPDDMVAEIGAACAEAGRPVPTDPLDMVRLVIESLAAAFVSAVDDAAGLSGREVRTIHLVGGGAQNVLLCRRTAARSGRSLVAGPTEATALGNVGVQAQADGALPRGLGALRAAVALAHPPVTYSPPPAEPPQEPR